MLDAIAGTLSNKSTALVHQDWLNSWSSQLSQSFSWRSPAAFNNRGIYRNEFVLDVIVEEGAGHNPATSVRAAVGEIILGLRTAGRFDPTNYCA